jgi:threonine dehydrogenase-like Zn-dependent dehydrogenase
MRAIVRRGGAVEVVEVDAPVPRPGEVMVAVALAGTCRTDLLVADGKLPVAEGLILGHELSGRIMTSASPERNPGQRVTVIPAIPCTRCAGCSASHEQPERCTRPRFLGVDEDGAFARFVRVPARCTLPLPEAVTDMQGAFVEPLAAALAVLGAGLRAEDEIAVVGRNRIGELVARVLETAHGKRPTVLDENEPGHQDAFDAVVETVPTSAGLDRALTAVRPGGKLVLKSRPAARVPFDLALAVRKEISLQGARYGSFADAILWLAQRRIDISDLLGPVFPLEGFADAFALARGQESKKVFIAPGDPS